MNAAFETMVNQREIQIGIIGLGYVGLPLAMEVVAHDFPTIGFDIDTKKIAMLAAGKTYLKRIPESAIAGLYKKGIFTATVDFSELKNVDCIIICVPTPLTVHREPDLSYIESTAKSIVPYLHKGQIVILESTSYPGTTEEVLLPILESNGLKCGEDIFLVYSPEREDPGNKEYTTSRIPKVLSGYTRECYDRASLIYGQIFDTVVGVSSTRVAEAVKLTENIFRSVNIALVNELKVIYQKMGIDIWEVIDAAKTKPFGFMPFYPGPGLGGHCIPIDPFYLTWKAREYGCNTRFIEIAGEINTAMPEYVMQTMMNALNERGRAVKNSKILIVGLAYKKDIDDLRESPSLKLFELLEGAGAHVDYYDPFIPVISETRDYKALAGRESIILTPEAIQDYEAVLISTDHSSIDYHTLVKYARLVIDTRNAAKEVKEDREKIVKA